MPEEPVGDDGFPCAHGDVSNADTTQIPKRTERRMRHQVPNSPLVGVLFRICATTHTLNRNLSSYFFCSRHCHSRCVYTLPRYRRQSNLDVDGARCTLDARTCGESPVCREYGERSSLVAGEAFRPGLYTGWPLAPRAILTEDLHWTCRSRRAGRAPILYRE